MANENRAKLPRGSGWRRLFRALPVRVGLVCAGLGILLAIVGIIRGNVPANPLSIGLALLISGASWGIVSWAVATAVVDVEAESEEEGSGE